MNVVNHYIDRLGPYPMQRLANLIAGLEPAKPDSPIVLSIGEPRHPLPSVIVEALATAAPTVNTYPSTRSCIELRQAIAQWAERRFAPIRLDPERQILPVNGAREGLFSFFQAVVDTTRSGSHIICPNPGYAVYGGAAILSGLHPYYLATQEGDSSGALYDCVPESVWRNTQVVFVCSPDNPRGTVLTQRAWERLFALSDLYGFVIAADECYCEIYVDEADAPVGALQAAVRCGRDYERLLSFFSLSKRSNAPGLRSGFIAGDAALLQRIEEFRSYNGGGMNQAVQAASIAAWSDEIHVVQNRALYREKYEKIIPLLQQSMHVACPQAGFFLWGDIRHTGLNDEEFTRLLYATQNVLVLPGTYLATAVGGQNPGAGFVRIALVESLEECIEGARRIAQFCDDLLSGKRK
jgi:N-succinyldiaminopimelate aminotransferase